MVSTGVLLSACNSGGTSGSSTSSTATTAGKITQALVNLGVPGAYGFKLGSNLAKTAIQSKKAGNYFTLSNPALRGAADKAIELNNSNPDFYFKRGKLKLKMDQQKNACEDFKKCCALDNKYISKIPKTYCN
jgi:hypothetical protein